MFCHVFVVYVCSLDQGRAAMPTEVSLNYKSNQIRNSCKPLVTVGHEDKSFKCGVKEAYLVN